MSIHTFMDLSNISKYRNGTCWSDSIGKTIYFEYEEVKDTVEVLDYSKEESEIKFKYKDEVHSMTVSSFKKVRFGKVLGKITNEFKVEIGTTYSDDKRNITIIDREYGKHSNSSHGKFYKYKCNKCGYEGKMRESHVLNNIGCSCCHGNTVIPGVNDIATTAPWIIKYLANKEDAYKYTYRSNKKVQIKCPDCGRIKNKKVTVCSLYNDHISCTCGDGYPYPEKFLLNVLEQLNLNHVYQYNKFNVDWCDKYKYDFYLEDQNIIIETHGDQHYRKVNLFTSGEEQQEIDKIKKKLALDNNIKQYIVLDCRYSNKEYIKSSILSSKLTDYYNFSCVNWDEANNFATKNIIKEVCEFYEANKHDMLIKDMLESLKMNRTTLLRYLNKGNELNWCKYVKNKKVRVVEIDEVFDTIKDCERQLNKRFDINFTSSNIIKVCKGERETHRGLHFEYVKLDKV